MMSARRAVDGREGNTHVPIKGNDTYRHEYRKRTQGSAGGPGIIFDPLCGELDHTTRRKVLLGDEIEKGEFEEEDVWMYDCGNC